MLMKLKIIIKTLVWVSEWMRTRWDSGGGFTVLELKTCQKLTNQSYFVPVTLVCVLAFWKCHVSWLWRDLRAWLFPKISQILPESHSKNIKISKKKRHNFCPSCLFILRPLQLLHCLPPFNLLKKWFNDDETKCSMVAVTALK